MKLVIGAIMQKSCWGTCVHDKRSAKTSGQVPCILSTPALDPAVLHIQVIVDLCRLAGLEQTVESKPLPDFPFEERTVLVLGTESSGIPPQILQVNYDVQR